MQIHRHTKIDMVVQRTLCKHNIRHIVQSVRCSCRNEMQGRRTRRANVY